MSHLRCPAPHAADEGTSPTSTASAPLVLALCEEECHQHPVSQPAAARNVVLPPCRGGTQPLAAAAGSPPCCAVEPQPAHGAPPPHAALAEPSAPAPSAPSTRRGPPWEGLSPGWCPRSGAWRAPRTNRGGRARSLPRRPPAPARRPAQRGRPDPAISALLSWPAHALPQRAIPSQHTRDNRRALTSPWPRSGEPRRREA